MLRFPNRTAQAGTYQAGTPNTIDVASGAAETGMRTFIVTASADSWAIGDRMGLLVKKSDLNWQVWRAIWSDGDQLQCETLEDSSGTINDDDAVTVSAIVTGGDLERQREVLTADRTYYVATTGNDANDGRSSGSPFLTIQRAVDVVCSIDFGLYQVTIQLADGTYTAGAVLKPFIGALKPIIQGNVTTPENVVINVSSGSALLNISGLGWTVRGIKLVAAVAGLFASFRSAIFFSSMNFGACGAGHIYTETLGIIVAESGYTISGASASHFTIMTGMFSAFSKTITLTGTPSFSAAFAYVLCGGVANLVANTFSGSATGRRYNVTLNGVVRVNGAGTSHFPGNAAGTLATGGQYA
jgi:hypothetical protein